MQQCGKSKQSTAVACNVDPQHSNDTNNSMNRVDTVGLNFLILEQELTFRTKGCLRFRHYDHDYRRRYLQKTGARAIQCLL